MLWAIQPGVLSERVMEKSHKITRILGEWRDGKRDALDELIPLVYNELHRQAKRYLRRERGNHTLQTTALINEAYLRLVDQRNIGFESRAHFFAIAAQQMRRILVDHARSKHREKRGGHDAPLQLDETIQISGAEPDVDLLALDEALDRLASVDPQQARVVELRYFSGLTLEETAAVMDVSRTSVATDWRMAKAWLHRELTK
jgi:RNA polymerase sigma factor (TIGR02999 family)